MEMLELIQAAVNSLGFPIAMVAYFIWDKQNTMKPLVESINNMNALLQVLIEKFDIQKVSDGA